MEDRVGGVQDPVAVISEENEPVAAMHQEVARTHVFLPYQWPPSTEDPIVGNGQPSERRQPGRVEI